MSGPSELSIEAILAALQPRLDRFFAARVTDRTVRGELTSIVNERLVRKLAAGEVIEDLERFAFGVARHVLQEHWRSDKKRKVTEATLSPTVENLGRDLSTTIETGVHSRKALLRALTACLDALAEGDRQIAERCYGDGKSKENRAALAEELGLTRNTLDARISRIRAKLEACVSAKLASPLSGD